MRIDILTLFPEMFEPILGTSILGRAREKGILTINPINIREFAKNKHRLSLWWRPRNGYVSAAPF